MTPIHHLTIVQQTISGISVNMGIAQKLLKVFTDLFVMTWDLWLAALNILLPQHKSGHVVAAGVPGHNGKWPQYVAPRKGDSRSACPMLNAMVRQLFGKSPLFSSHPRNKAAHIAYRRTMASFPTTAATSRSAISRPRSTRLSISLPLSASSFRTSQRTSSTARTGQAGSTLKSLASTMLSSTMPV